MIQTLRSEVRKLLSIRSTYFVAAIALTLTALFTYFGTTPSYTVDKSCQVDQTQVSQSSDGKHTTFLQDNCPAPTLNTTLPKDQMETNVENTAQGIGTFLAVMAVLVMAHEYRYNTITYSLTLARKRWQVLASKLVVVAGYVLAVTLLAMVFTIAFTHLAVSIKGLVLPSQTVSWPAVIGRALFYDIGFALFGLGAITLLRNMVAGFVTVFAAFTIDGILSGILTHYQIEPTKYLPFNALSRVLTHNPVGTISPTSAPTPFRAALTYLGYLGLLWIVAWVLFLRRDAN